MAAGDRRKTPLVYSLLRLAAYEKPRTLQGDMGGPFSLKSTMFAGICARWPGEESIHGSPSTPDGVS
jgi:hypothetical protein